MVLKWDWPCSQAQGGNDLRYGTLDCSWQRKRLAIFRHRMFVAHPHDLSNNKAKKPASLREKRVFEAL
jgi:hypothetical protein